MANEMPVFYFWNVVFQEIVVLMFLVTKVILVCILWNYCKRLVLWKTMNMLLVSGMGVTHEHYNMQIIVNMKSYFWTHVSCIFICLLIGYNNTWELITTT